MKRTLSGELPSNSSQTNTLNTVPAVTAPNNPQQANAANNGAPVMHALAANDTAIENPLPAFDIDAPLPDWEEFAQMLPHTPPVENRRQTSEEGASASSSDELSVGEPSFEEFSAEESSSSGYDENFVRDIEGAFGPTHNLMTVWDSGSKKLNELLEVCKRHPRLTELHVLPSVFSFGFTEKMQKTLTEFFKTQHSIQSLYIKNPQPSEEVIILPELLMSLLQSTSLKKIEITDFQFPALTDFACDLRTEARRGNSRLEELEIISLAGGPGLASFIGALADVGTLKRLVLASPITPNIADSLASLLRSNCPLQELRISLVSSDALQNLDVVFKAIKESSALEVLSFRAAFSFAGKSNLEPLKLLAGCQHLKAVELPHMGDMSAEAVKNFSELLVTLPALIKVGLACLPSSQKDRLSLARALASLPRLERIETGVIDFLDKHSSQSERSQNLSEFLTMLGKSKHLRFLQLSNLRILGPLVKFLETHPQISSICLLDFPLSEGAMETLITLVKNSSHIESFSFGFYTGFDESTSRFLEEMEQALAINRQIQKNMEAASQAMHGLLYHKHIEDATQPFVPRDVTNELASAIARYLPSDKAKAIFDELIIHDPTYRPQ